MTKQNNYKIVGTTNPIYVPTDESKSKVVRPGEGYYFVKIQGAQAAFYGSIWQNVKRLVVTSQVNLHHSAFQNESLFAIQHSREVKRRHAEQLGLTPNIIKLIPAVMSQVSVSINFILDKENRLAQLSALINEDAFLTAVSLSPALAAVAKRVGGLSQKIIQTFIKPEEREPILQFSGDFNIAADGLKTGYYVILGTRDDKNPIPSQLPKLRVSDGQVYANEARVTQLSYVVLEVQCTEVRTRYLNEDAVWDSKLREAEGNAEQIADNPFVKNEERTETWKKCLHLINEARILLSADPNYLHQEAMNIVKATYLDCYGKIFMVPEVRGQAIPKLSSQPDFQRGLSILNISREEDINTTLNSYANQVAQARRVFKKCRIL